MGDDFAGTYGAPLFGVMRDGGYVPVGTVDEAEVSVAAPDDVTGRCERPMLDAQTFAGTLEVDVENVGEALRAIGVECAKTAAKIRDVAVCLEQARRRWRYRHDRVWAYRMERKGDKSNRRRRGRWQQYEVRTVLNGGVTGVNQPLSAGVDAPLEVTFEGRPAWAN